MNSQEEKRRKIDNQPPEGLESPFLEGELFAEETDGEWEARLGALEAESTFRLAFEQGKTAFSGQDKSEEEFVKESKEETFETETPYTKVQFEDYENDESENHDWDDGEVPNEFDEADEKEMQDELRLTHGRVGEIDKETVDGFLHESNVEGAYNEEFENELDKEYDIDETDFADYQLENDENSQIEKQVGGTSAGSLTRLKISSVWANRIKKIFNNNTEFINDLINKKKLKMAFLAKGTAKVRAEKVQWIFTTINEWYLTKDLKDILDEVQISIEIHFDLNTNRQATDWYRQFFHGRFRWLFPKSLYVFYGGQVVDEQKSIEDKLGISLSKILKDTKFSDSSQDVFKNRQHILVYSILPKDKVKPFLRYRLKQVPISINKEIKVDRFLTVRRVIRFENRSVDVENIKFLLEKMQNAQYSTNFVKRLIVDLDQFIKSGGRVKVTIELIEQIGSLSTYDILDSKIHGIQRDLAEGLVEDGETAVFDIQKDLSSDAIIGLQDRLQIDLSSVLSNRTIGAKYFLMLYVHFRHDFLKEFVVSDSNITLDRFGFGTYDLTNSHIAILKIVAKYIADTWRGSQHWTTFNPVVKVEMDGGADVIGGIEYNQQLGLDRANEVKNKLMELVNQNIPLNTTFLKFAPATSHGKDGSTSKNPLDRTVDITLTKANPQDLVNQMIKRGLELLDKANNYGYKLDSIKIAKCMLRKLKNHQTVDDLYIPPTLVTEGRGQTCAEALVTDDFGRSFIMDLFAEKRLLLKENLNQNDIKDILKTIFQPLDSILITNAKIKKFYDNAQAGPQTVNIRIRCIGALIQKKVADPNSIYCCINNSNC